MSENCQIAVAFMVLAIICLATVGLAILVGPRGDHEDPEK